MKMFFLFFTFIACHIYSINKLYVTSQNPDVLTIIDTINNTVLKTLTLPGNSAQVLISPNGRLAYIPISSDTSRFIMVLNTYNDTFIAAIDTNTLNLAITPNGQKIYGTNFYEPVSVISTLTNKVISTISGVENARNPFVTPNGLEVWILSNTGIYIIDTTSDLVTNFVTTPGEPISLVFTPDGIKAYVTYSSLGTPSTTVSSIDTETKVVSNITSPAGSVDLAVTPNGEKIYVNCLNAQKISVITTADNILSTPITITDFPLNLAITPNGNQLYGLCSDFSSDANIKIYNISDNSLVQTVSLEGFYPDFIDTAILFTPSGNKAFVLLTSAISSLDVLNNNTLTTIAGPEFPTSQAIASFQLSIQEILSLFPSPIKFQKGVH